MDHGLIIGTALAIVGVSAILASRLPAFRDNTQLQVSSMVTAVSLLTLVLSVQVITAAHALSSVASAVGVEEAARVNGLLLAGLVLLLVSGLAFSLAFGVLLWSLGEQRGRRGASQDARSLRVEN